MDDFLWAFMAQELNETIGPLVDNFVPSTESEAMLQNRLRFLLGAASRLGTLHPEFLECNWGSKDPRTVISRIGDEILDLVEDIRRLQTPPKGDVC